MGKTATRTRTRDLEFEIGVLRSPALPKSARQIVFRSAGRRHGPIRRLVSPSDVGEIIKPFVFLDHGEVPFTESLSSAFIRTRALQL